MTEPTRAQIYDLAARAEVAPATAKKALVYGVAAIRGEVVRERLEKALKKAPKTVEVT
jgi:hypothetical protein